MDVQFPALDVAVDSITPAAFKRRLDEGEQWTMVDTRRETDFEAWKLTHPNLTVINLPFTEFLDESERVPADTVPAGVPETPLMVSCAKGISSQYVAEFLAREGWDVLALEDGMEGWARLDEMRPLETDGTVDVVQFHRPSSGCLAYLLVSNDEAAVVDPLRAFAPEYVQEAHRRDATVRYVLDTHVHADHISGVREVAELTGADPVLPRGARDRGLEFEATLVESGATLSLGSTEIQAVGLPGHTTEMMGYRAGGVFLTGDTLFLDGVARPDLEDHEAARAAAGQLWETLQLFETLPDGTIIGPGHIGPTTAPASDGTFTATIGSLRARLDAFEQERTTFVERVTTDLPPRPNNFEQIISVNLGRESVTEAEAFELELGPNNCAVAD